MKSVLFLLIESISNFFDIGYIINLLFIIIISMTTI